MKSSVFVFVVVAVAVLSTGCSTLYEATAPGETTSGYVATRNESGETVYRRERVYATPTPSPTPFPVVMAPLQSQSVETKRAVPAAEASGESSGDFGVGLEMSSDRKRLHLGLMLLKEFDFVDGKIGVSLFNADKDLYAGFDLGVRPKIKINEFAIFGGAGIYGGDTRKCQSTEFSEVCEKKFLFAGYVEAGVSFAYISLFARSYNIEEAGKQIPSDTFFGLGIQTTY